MSYITGATYPSSDRPQLGATEEETLRAYADAVSAGVDGSGNVGHRCTPLNAVAPRVRGALSSIRHTPRPVTCTARAPGIRKAPGRHL